MTPVILILLLATAKSGSSFELNGNVTGLRNLTKADSPYIVTSNIVVRKGATLNVEPGVEIYFSPGVGLKVHGTLKAQGMSTSRITLTKLQSNETVDLDKINDTIPYNKGGRLKGGADYRSGRLELLADNQWGSVCYNHWTTSNTEVACRMLGFVGGKRYYSLRHGVTKTMMYNVNCKGTEESLLDCPHRPGSEINCRYYSDIGIECYTFLPLLAERVYWSGIEYKDTASQVQMRYVDIHKAFIGIHGHKVLPPLYNVTLTSSIRGIKSAELKDGEFFIHDTVISDSMVNGIVISSNNASLNINNSVVFNTTNGDGIEYSRIRKSSVDLSDVHPSNASFPLYLTVSSKSWETEDTIKVFNTSTGHTLALHFQFLKGQGYYIEARDGDNINSTLLTRVTQSDSGRAVKLSFTTGNVLWIRYRHTYQREAAAELLITESSDKSSLTITNSKFIGNNGFGMALKDIPNPIYIENTEFSRNTKDGMMAKNQTGKISGYKLRFSKNDGNGVAFYHSSISFCHLSDIKAFNNQEKGMLLQISWVNCSITHAHLVLNNHQGLLSNKVSGALDLAFCSISDNQLSGIEIYEGMASVSIYSSYILQNSNHGLKLRNEGGEHRIIDSFIEKNRQHGICMHEFQSSSSNPIPQLTGINIQGTKVSDNLHHGVYLSPACQHIEGSTENVSIVIEQSSISNNSRGGLRFTQESCSRGSRYKQVSLMMSHNEFRENKNQALYASCISLYRLKAEIRNNSFYNNSGQIIVITDQNSYECKPKSVSNPVEVSINQNRFFGNRGSNLVYIDFMGFPLIRRASVDNNTFQNNSVKLSFPNLYQTSTDIALVVFKEGTFTFHKNALDANDGRYLLSTSYVNHSSFVDARFNWWGTKDECEIKDKIFDFYDRIQLAKVRYFPYFRSSRIIDLQIERLPHMRCFLQDNSIGGALDGELTLPRSQMPYKVRDDIVILENGSLRIPSNTTLMFPARSGMMVQGELHVMGKNQEKVNFIKYIIQENIRLSGGQGPWEGVLEFYTNNTWIPVCDNMLPLEVKVVCRHLGFIERYTSHRYISPKPTDQFVFGIKCLDPDEDDIIQCSNKNWTFGKNCYRVPLMYCLRDYWAGVHLAISNKKSELHHLNIYDAGFNYRSDISLPGYALRIDFDHHNLSNVNINSSSGIGVQVLFPSPFLKKSFMPNSKISHTASAGIMLGSPYLKLTDVEVESTGAAGFQLQSQWDVSTSHAIQTMNPSVKKIAICSQNITYLKEDDIVHLYSSLPYESAVTCQHLFVTERSRRLGIQVLYSQLRYSRLHVFDGNNITSRDVWKIETFNIKDRKVFNSSNNEALLKLEKRYHSTVSFHLLLFSIKDEKPLESFIELENSNFNWIRGINIEGNVISQLKIINCSMSNSSYYLKIYAKEITTGTMQSSTLETNSYGIHLAYTSGDFGIYDSNIFKTGNTGLYLHSYSAYDNNKMVFNLFNCSITHNYRGFVINGYFSRTIIAVQNSTFAFNRASAISLEINEARQNMSFILKWNSFKQNQGVTMSIYLCRLTDTECSITENSFENNVGSVITVRSCGYWNWNDNNMVLMKRNIFSANQCRRGAVIYIYERMYSLEASHNVFQFNQGVILMYNLYHSGPLKMFFNIFKSNNCTGRSIIEIQRINSYTELVLNENIFERNTGVAVLSTGTSSYHCSGSLQLRRNAFRYNLCIEKSVLSITKQRNAFEASGNDFHSNLGSNLIFEGVYNMADLLFANNSIENNTCISREMVSILRMEGNIDVSNNTFFRNKAIGIMSVQSLHTVEFQQDNKSFSIINNTFRENQVAADALSRVYLRNNCVLKLRGLLYYKITEFFHNKLANPSFEKEFCLHIQALSQKDIFIASHNWWGTVDNYHLRQRIFDFDENHDYTIASTSPFLTSYNDNKTVMIGNKVRALRGNKLGGRVNESLYLTEEAGPYEVTSDLTILPGVVLTIEPNVSLRFSPGVSLLVIGTLIARGTRERKIKFTLDNPKGSQSVRLKDGHFPWEGRLEVYHENKWMPVCCPDSTWNPANTKVICRELGYLPHQDALYTKFDFGPSKPWPFKIHCYGNETSLSKCDVKEHSYASNTSIFVQLNCKGQPWGNIRFVKSNENGTVKESSVLEHVEICYCGRHFNSNASAIESVIRNPKINFVTIQNCTFQGVSYFLAGNNINVTKCELKHLQGNGFNVIQSSFDVTIKDSTIENTVNGVVMESPQQHNIPLVQYGRTSICDPSIKTFDVKNKSIVFFELNDIDTEKLSSIPNVNCQKDFRAETEGQGVRIRLLFHQGLRTINIYDKRRTHKFKYNYPEYLLKTILHKDLIFPEIGNIELYGNLKSRVMFEVDVVDIHSSDIPCNFQYGMCGWQSFSNMTINGINMTKTWEAKQEYYTYNGYYNYPQRDNSFNSNQGYVVGIGQRYWGYNLPGNASLVSPLLTSQSQFCKLVFYYKFRRSGISSFNVFLQKGNNIFDSSSELFFLWTPKTTEVLQWTKAVLELPKDYLEYRIIFIGSYTAATNRYTRNFFILDDIQIQKCATGKDELENNIIRNSDIHGVMYKSYSRNYLSIKRNAFIENGNSKTAKHSVYSGVVFAEIKDKDFLFTNNHVAGNAIGGLHVQTENSEGHLLEGRKLKKSWVYGNTFVQNGKEALYLVSNKGTPDVVYIKHNYFSSNYGKGFVYNSKNSVVKIKDVPTKIEGNFFFNNSGLLIMEYVFLNDKYEGQHCINNTFFLNTGTASEYGATIRTNGPIQYHSNSLKNPHNLYEIDTTISAVTDPVNATMNWFGFGTMPTVKRRLRDHDNNNRLPKILFEPFVKIQPRNILSLGCPPDWMNMGPACYVFRAGVQSFQDADKYCKYYGGHILVSSSPGDNELLIKIMAMTKPGNYDQPPPIPLWIISNDLQEKNDRCQVLSHEGNITEVSCKSHYSFACSRSVVIRCPNGCLHNGDCIGSTCFCYRGWTGEDCSKPSCRDVHNCSGVGECVGPNVCKCKWSFRGRACTYSYCSKFRNCSTCVTDPYCGWCDKMRQCIPGDYSSPYKKSCSDWFYYHCYTVGSESHCSDNIGRVDCQLRQCNFGRHSSNVETCAKCRDLEKCYNIEEAGKCRAWNVSRCPHGMLQVDYSDKSRVNNTQLRSNVKVIDPNRHTIYSCPVLIPGKDEVTSVFVVPKELGIEVGHVMTSTQAGGIMHKVNETKQIGPYTLVLGEEAELEDVIEYADFEEKVQPEPITDEVTEEEKPNKEQIDGMFNGSILLNNTAMHLIQGKYIYKCVGHLYQIGSKSVVSHYLVMEAASSINASQGDVIVARESHGFIERVTNIRKTESLTFIHTMLERCDGKSTWTKKFKPHLTSSEGDDVIVCSGGDNNPGLLVSESEEKVSVNDSVIGRRSQPFISKVLSSSVNGKYVIMEVLPVISVMNGTAITQVQIDQLHAKHRRAKREVDYKFPFSESNSKEVTLVLEFGTELKVGTLFEVDVNPNFKFGVFSEKGADGKQKMSDTILGIEITGRFFVKIDLALSVKTKLNFVDSMAIVRPKQLGKAFCIRFGPFVCVKSAFFFELNLNQKITAETTAEIQTRSTLAIENLFIGGMCSFNRRGCDPNVHSPDIKPEANLLNIKTNGKVSLETMVEPKLSYKIPVQASTPSISPNNWKTWWKYFKGIRLKVDISKLIPVVLSLSIAVPFGIRMDVTPCFPPSDIDNKWNNELTVDQYYGDTSLVGELSAGLYNWETKTTLYNHKVHSSLKKSSCVQLYPYDTKDKCQCQPSTTTAATTRPSQSTLPTTWKTPATYPWTITWKTPVTYPWPTTWKTPATYPWTTTWKTPVTYPWPTRPIPTPQTRPTPPPPCICRDGQIGVFSSYRRVCDCLPKCKGGQAPVKVNGLYKCPYYPPCGRSPNCVIGRKGSSCSQPDVYPCTSACSGNGRTVSNKCQTECGCFRGWTGRCCEIRRPTGGFGDPHLETLDGVEFDYFGIGEFWGCRSIPNSFGIQFRFFAHKGTSLIGGIALKAGSSVVSIMSQITLDPTDMPHLRIDGALVNLTTALGKQLSIDNKTTFLEIQKQSDEKNKGEVVFFSLEYKSGVTVTIYVRHSNTMGRQFLNVLYTLTADFKGRTQGICGLMDNNPANDLTGPNGELYTDPVKFADSWRILATNNQSGLYDSWSWNSSNFHADDEMDSTYTDPSHVPMYGLSNVPSDLLQKSRQTCLARKLPDNLLKSCIYDVAVTNDTSFAMQEVLLTGCPDQCSGKGRCVNQTCECLKGWTGEKCEIGTCPNCSTSNGKCIKGFCQCNSGWQGDTCSEKATCYDVKNCTSPVHGVCKTTNKCLCNDGYMGNDCSIIPTCLNVSSCSGHGKCVNFDVCKCDEDWTGSDCSQYSCSDLDRCSDHGRCVNVYQCECNAGWTGISCAIPDCPDVHQCSGNGTCVAPNKCQCYPGYSGNGCLDSADCSMLANCSNHGDCVSGDGANSSCRCYDGFQGVDCSQPTCTELNNCSNHGICKEAGFCECDVGFSGSDCSNASCEALNFCSGHGECIGYDLCKCEPSWHGAACSIPDCSALSDCSKQGDCLAPNKCECYPGYDGIKCDKAATPNFYPPVFSSPVYNLSVYENATLGSFVGQVNASDLDQGRNGEVMYYLSNDVGGLFTVEGESGKIFTYKSLRYDVLKTDFAILGVRASDNGKPMKFASCEVHIRIIDVNDNCPIFDPFLQTSYNISVNTKIGAVIANVSAVDKDNGVNGDVRYHLENGNGTFSNEWLTGSIRLMLLVRPISYQVVVIARDQGTPSCSTSLKLVFNVTEKETPKPTEVTNSAEVSTTVTTTTEPVTRPSEPNIIHSTNDGLRLESVLLIAGCSIGVCLLAAISTFIVIRMKRKLKKANTSPRTSRRQMMTGSRNRVSPDFQDDPHDMEMQVWTNIHANRR